MQVNHVRQNLFPLLAAFIWGTSFVAQSVAADSIGPFTFNAARSAVAFVFLLALSLILWRARRNTFAAEPEPRTGTWRDLLIGGLCCGAALAVASFLQQKGLETTTAGKSGFITAMYIVIVPVLGIFLKKKPRPILWVSVALACVGLYFLCFTDKTFSLAMGDAAMLGGAVMFALHIMVVDHFSPLVDGVCLSFVQFLTAGSLGMVVAFITEQPSFAALSAAAVPILYTGVFTMGVAYTLQIVAQKDTDPTVASLILCMESVFAVVFGWLILHETLSLREGVGSVFMFVAVLLAQLA